MTVAKLSEAGQIIYRSIMDSEYLEDLQKAETQDDFESSIIEIAYDIVEAMTEVSLELNPIDGLRYREEQLEYEIKRNEEYLEKVTTQIKELGYDV